MTVTPFLALAFIASVSISVTVSIFNLAESSVAQMLGLTVMLMPSLIVILLRLTERTKGTPLGFRHFNWRVTVVGLLLVVGFSHFAMLLGSIIIIGEVPLADWVIQGNPIWNPPNEMKLGSHLQTMSLFVGILVKLLVGLSIVSIFTLGEEVGWRGYLSSRLVSSKGVTKGLILGAFAWSCWHIPFAFSGLHHILGLSSTESAIAMFTGLFGAGLFIGAAYDYTKSIWVAALIHGALNNWAQFFFRWFVSEKANLNQVLLWSQNIGLLLLGGITLYFYQMRLTNRRS